MTTDPAGDEPVPDAPATVDDSVAQGPLTGRWCPSCGDEYRPDIESCVDCFVDLVDAKPRVLQPVATSTEIEQADEAFIIDFATLTEEQQAVLLEHIEVVPVPVKLVGEGLIQAEDGYELELELALTRVLSGGSPRRLRPAVSMVGAPLSLTRRWLAFSADSIIVGATVGVVDQLFDGGIVSLLAITISVVNQVVGMKERGRSFGKMLVGAVVRTYQGDEISWSAAAVRWLVKDGLSTVPVILWWAFEGGRSVWVIGQVVAGAYFWGLVVSVVVDLQRRGLHDLVIDGAVMSASSVSRPGSDIAEATRQGF